MEVTINRLPCCRSIIAYIRLVDHELKQGPTVLSQTDDHRTQFQVDSLIRFIGCRRADQSISWIRIWAKSGDYVTFSWALKHL
jgi:hypothetical protein